jgi:pimeloyl-ACP methyl ester carboxylesterase
MARARDFAIVADYLLHPAPIVRGSASHQGINSHAHSHSHSRREIVRGIAAGLLVLAIGSPPLVAQQSPGPGGFIDVEGGKIWSEECGSGSQTLVLIHDGVVHSAVWDDVWPTVCRDFRVVRYDRRGYGRSPAATAWHSETDDLLAVLDAHRVARAALVASSHGGELAIDFTLRAPDRVEILVLVGAVLSGFPYSDHFINRGMKASEPLGANDVAGAIDRWSRDPYLLAPGHPAAQKRLAALLTAAPQDLTHPNRVRPARPALHRLGEIRAPTLILVGDADIPDVHAHAGAIELGIPNAERVIVPETGHLMYLEKPAEFARLVTTFVHRHGGKQAP